MPRASSYRSLGDALRADAGRAIAMATGGALAFAPVEYALTLASYAGAVRWTSRLLLIALTATLALWLWLLLALGLAALLAAARLVRAQLDPALGRAPDWLEPPAPCPRRGVRPGVARVWAAVATAIASALVVQRVAAIAIAHYKEPQLTAALIAGAAVAWLGVALVLRRAFAAAAAIAADAVAPVLGPANPLGRWRAAGVALAGLAGAALAIAYVAAPAFRSVLPVRLAISAIVVGLGMGLGLHTHARPRRTPRRRGPALGLAGAAFAVTTATLLWLGADLETKYIAITASPALDKLIGVVRLANDLDRDGFGSLLGEGDCAPLDPRIHPGAIDTPDNGVDENCDGHDFSLRSVAGGPTDARGVPSRFQRDWNILFITVDTLRYDHTTFGGYADSPKHRDTTPNLAALARRSVSFSFANAPSAGTMASIPAILTSKYFHSGIALDENRPAGTPPGILPENTTLPEIMKRKGYTTGVVSSHVWWNNWGLEQGVDDYDNSIARTDDPFRVAADRVTDHVLAWVSRQQGKKWFMWAHYIDPHGRYVAHPEVVDYGSSEPDLYDAEIKWTDQELGRLFRELARLPSHASTIIVLTSDHGDSMGEHTVPVGTHGTALYEELQHVPLIFAIPDNPPRTVGGAVSNLDVVPTIAALCGIDVHDLSFEGKSLVPQLFYDHTEDHARVVFAETNAPQKERAAISEGWKLIYYLASNLYELYDLKADPGEHANLAAQNPPALGEMKQALEAWMDRVMYARDPRFNQAFRQISDVVLSAPPAPEVATAGQSIDGIDVVGIGVDPGKPLAPGGRADVHVYFHVTQPTATAYRFLLAAWPVDSKAPADPDPARMVRTPLRATADGAYATDHWRAGDYVRERFTLAIPADWRGDGIGLGLVTADPAGGKRKATGAALPADPFTAVLGTLPLAAAPGSPPPRPAPPPPASPAPSTPRAPGEPTSAGSPAARRP
ncbi:MAG TPA: sulfatase [Kofleriaceae bacterium]|nr:sulfatase [Kofleriaceae bacterium]